MIKTTQISSESNQVLSSNKLHSCKCNQLINSIESCKNSCRVEYLKGKLYKNHTVGAL